MRMCFGVDWLDCLPPLHLVLLLQIWVLISKFGLAFALVLIVLLCLLRHRRRGHLRCCVFCFCYGVVCFLSSPSSLHRSVLSFGWDFATSLFLEVEDNYPENLPDFYDVQVLFLFLCFCCTRWRGNLWFVKKVEENKLKNLPPDG